MTDLLDLYVTFVAPVIFVAVIGVFGLPLAAGLGEVLKDIFSARGDRAAPMDW